MAYRAGRHFLQIPGPSPVPDRISRAIDAAVIDHRGPDFAELGLSVLSGMQRIFKTQAPVVFTQVQELGRGKPAFQTF